MVRGIEKLTATLSLGAGSILLMGGFLLPLPLLDSDPTLPADSGPLLLEFASQYRGILLLTLLFAVVGVGIVSATAGLRYRFRILGPLSFDLAARWGFAAGLLWLLRAVFLASVRGPWALRYAGTLEPAARKELIVLLWPLLRQLESFFQWSGAICLGLSFALAGTVLIKWPGRLRLCGLLQCLTAVTILVSLCYVLPVHYPRRFAQPGFPTLGVFLCSVAMFETTALALLSAGYLLWFPDDRETEGPEEFD